MSRPKLSDEERKERKRERDRKYIQKRKEKDPDYMKNYLKEWHEKNPDYHKNYMKDQYHDRATVSKANVRNLAAKMVERAKKKQAKLGLPWDERITVELLVEMTLERWACADTNEPFHDLRFPGCYPSRPWAPSLDRIDSKIGYTLDGPGKYGNLQVVCMFVNRAKSNLPNRVSRSFLKVAP